MKKINLLMILFFLFIFVFVSENTYAENIEKVQEYGYCIYDVYNQNHLEKMEEYIQDKLNNDVKLYTYYNHELLWSKLNEESPLMNCDIINMSLMTTFSYFFPEGNLYRVKTNLFEYNDDIIVVSSAGNYRDVYKQNIFSKSKNENIYIVGQASLEGDKVTHHYATGEAIDFVVPNYDETKGTSAATGYITSLFINALEKGVPKSDLKKILVFSGIYTVDNIDYRLLDMEKTEENIELYINKEKLNESVYHHYSADYDKPLPYGIGIIIIVCFIVFVFIGAGIIYLKYWFTLKLINK